MAVPVQATIDAATLLAKTAIETDLGQTVADADMQKTKEFVIAPIVQAILDALETEGIIVTS